MSIVVAPHSSDQARAAAAVFALDAVVALVDLRWGRLTRVLLIPGAYANSRIENATRDLGRPFLVSEDALGRLAGARGDYALEDLGPQQLRGRQAAMQVSAAEVAPGTGG